MAADHGLSLSEKLQANLRIIIFLALVGLLGFVFYLRTSLGVPPPPTGAGAANSSGEKFASPPEGVEDAERVDDVLAEAPPIADTDFRELVTRSMFSVKAIMDDVAREEQAADRYRRARAAYQAGDYAEAMELIDEVLQIRPRHLGATQLREEIQRVAGGAETTPAEDGSEAPAPADGQGP